MQKHDTSLLIFLTKWSLLIVFTVLWIIIGSLDLLAQSKPPLPASTEINGAVFEDNNYDGIANEISFTGVTGVQVDIYDADNNLVNTTSTDANGAYLFSGLTEGTAYRVEFLLTCLPACNYQPTLSGIDNGTLIQFVSSGEQANLGVFNPDNFCGENLELIIPCYNFGAYNGSYSTNDALVGVSVNKIDDPSQDALTSVTHYATHEEIGTTYGLAISNSRSKAYAAAFMKRHAGFGPNGTGAVYEIDLTQRNRPTLLSDLNVIYGAGTAGANPHDYQPSDTCVGGSNFACWFNDVNSWAPVGMTSLGDMDISDDESTLYVMNLEDRQIYQIDLNNPNTAQPAFPFPLNQDTDPSVTLKPRDPAFDVRPFALEYHNGLIYVGAVDSERSRHRDGVCCTKGGSVVYVYSLNPVTSSWNLVLEQDIQRAGIGPGDFFVRWNTFFQDHAGDESHMIVGDLEFDGNDIIMGIRDLSSDRFGSNAGKPIAGNSDLVFYPGKAGDIVRFCYNSSTGNYDFENNGTCGSTTTAGANSGYGWPEAATPRGSYYSGDYFNSQHPQTSLGALWFSESDNRIYLPVYNPLTNTFQAGIKALDNTTGLTREAYLLIQDTRPGGGFGKTNGLGDIEARCKAAPIEIGNYVWADTNRNGIQDAGETGLSGVIITLYNDACEVVAIDTTDASGNYHFNDAKIAAYTAQPDVTIAHNADYHLVINGVTGGSISPHTQALIKNGQVYLPTTANQGGNTQIDMDGTVATAAACSSSSEGYIIASITTCGEGCTLHDVDFGFAPVPEASLKLIKYADRLVDVNGNGVIEAQDSIYYRFTITNTGEIDLVDVHITDPIATVLGDTILSFPVGAVDSTTFTAGYEIQHKDIYFEGIENSATVTGIPMDSMGNYLDINYDGNFTNDAVTDISDTGTDPEMQPIASPHTTETANPLRVFPNDNNNYEDDPTTILLCPTVCLPISGVKQNKLTGGNPTILKKS